MSVTSSLTGRQPNDIWSGSTGRFDLELYGDSNHRHITRGIYILAYLLAVGPNLNGFWSPTSPNIRVHEC